MNFIDGSELTWKWKLQTKSFQIGQSGPSHWDKAELVHCELVRCELVHCELVHCELVSCLVSSLIK